MASFGNTMRPLLRQLLSTQALHVRGISQCSRLLASEGSKPPPPPAPKTFPPPPPAPVRPTQASVLDDNSQYRAKEYYSYSPMSFYDMEKDMMKFRVPQPSSKVPYRP